MLPSITQEEYITHVIAACGMFLSLSAHHDLNLVHKPLLPGEDSRLRAILHLQLAENIGDVPLDRLLT